jgi:dolichol-phosphate mannosyltransferase
MKKAVLVIPTYNERNNIAKVIPILLDVFKKIENWDMHILVVDDTSPDKTYEVVEKLAAQHARVHLFLNKTKSGLGGAYLKGMAEAFGPMKADVAFEFDADLSHDPSKIPAFLRAIENGAGLVLGSRYIRGGGIPDDWGLHRKFLSVFGNAIIMFVFTNFKIRDWTTGYRAITKEVYEAVHPHLHSKRFTGYTFQIGFLHRAVRQGFKIVEVPFKFVDRTDGQSKLGSEYIKNTLIYIFKVRFDEIVNNRLFKFAAVGGIGALIQLTAAKILPSFFANAPQILSLAPDLLAIELAVLSNFILNNIWTFADRKLNPAQYLSKFVQFNVASTGSILIQMLIIGSGLWLLGARDLFTLPIIPIVVTTRIILHITGIIIGMFWNFFAYSKFIWRASHRK